MKIRKSKSYVIIGTAHLGLSLPILKTISSFANHFEASVIHIGPLCTNEEKRMFDYRNMRIKTWEKLQNGWNPQIEELFERYSREIDKLLSIQQKRISTLEDVFESVEFVCNSEQMLPNNKMTLLGEEHLLCKYLTLSSVPANGDKITGDPITAKCKLAMREHGTSVVMAHPIPATEMYKKEGINCAYMFSTTGSLMFPEKCRRVTDIYKQIIKPAFLFVTVDEENQEFHPVRIRVKSHRDTKTHRHCPHIVFDGLLFTPNTSAKEISLKDRASYITDAHAPYHAPNVIDCFHALNKLHKPSVVIDGGDTSDFASVSRHTKHYPGARENLRLIDELQAMKDLLDGYKASCSSIKKVIVLDSNHPEWLTQFVEENPSLKGLLDWPSLSKNFFGSHEIIIRKGDTKAVWFGDLAIRHGDQEHSLMEAHLSYRNYVGGHYHSYNELGDAMRVGCAAKLDPRYLRGNNTSWQHFLTTFSIYRGMTCKHPRIVLSNPTSTKSRFMFRGKIYELTANKD